MCEYSLEDSTCWGVSIIDDLDTVKLSVVLLLKPYEPDCNVACCNVLFPIVNIIEDENVNVNYMKTTLWK